MYAHIFLGDICVHNPLARLFLLEIKKIANYRPCWWDRWIRQPASSSEVTEVNKEVKENEDGKPINSVHERELQDRTGRIGGMI
jgi:hypothetical protein